VHRATAARRVERARELLCDGTRAELAARIGLKGAELDSVMRLVRSNVDLSIARVLGRPKS
jgi:RNA polymerase sigma-70 factor (ECF subfamily)